MDYSYATVANIYQIMTLTLGRGLLMIIFFGTASFAYRYIVSKKKKPSRNQFINEVLTFVDAAPSDSEHYSLRPLLHPSTERILYYLNLAHETVDIYMEMITSLDVACQLMDLHHRGVKLRIVVEPDMAYTPASGVQLLEKQGVDVRLSTVDSSVRNFCLVDTSAEDTIPFIIFGSPPWSIEALSGDNNEIVLVTSRVAFIDVFKEEFERIYAAAI